MPCPFLLSKNGFLHVVYVLNCAMAHIKYIYRCATIGYSSEILLFLRGQAPVCVWHGAFYTISKFIHGIRFPGVTGRILPMYIYTYLSVIGALHSTIPLFFLLFKNLLRLFSLVANILSLVFVLLMQNCCPSHTGFKNVQIFRIIVCFLKYVFSYYVV